MTNTASSYEYFHTFDKHYNKVRKLIRENNLPDAFEYAFALMVSRRKIGVLGLQNNAATETHCRYMCEEVSSMQMNFKSDEAWYMDTDDEDGAKSVARRIFKVLKELLSSTDEALNLAGDSRRITLQITDQFRKELADSPIQIRVQALPR